MVSSYPLVLLQSICTIWTKASRGGASATARNGTPDALELPALAFPLTEGRFLLHEVVYTKLRSKWYTRGNKGGKEEDLFWECAIEVRLCLLRKGNITGIEVIKAAPYPPPKGVGGQ